MAKKYHISECLERERKKDRESYLYGSIVIVCI